VAVANCPTFSTGQGQPRARMLILTPTLTQRPIERAFSASRSHDQYSTALIWQAFLDAHCIRRPGARKAGVRMQPDRRLVFMSAMERYTYHPLPPGERRIRLLQLLPGSGSDNIQCDIINYTINVERPFGMYEALSYCWGDPRNPRRIQVKNQGDAASRYLDVTANLFEGMKRLRDPDMPRMMWIDAISIDQGNLEERGQQVGFMATIYAMASQVVVWLGVDAEKDDSAKSNREVFRLIRLASREDHNA
jgi:hypothetical protein